MATKRNKKPAKKVKTLRAKSLSAKQAKGVRGGAPTEASKGQGAGMSKTFWEWKR
jgi:hypothetical protein